jgi:hypothetical protein
MNIYIPTKNKSSLSLHLFQFPSLESPTHSHCHLAALPPVWFLVVEISHPWKLPCFYMGMDSWDEVTGNWGCRMIKWQFLLEVKINHCSRIFVPIRSSVQRIFLISSEGIAFALQINFTFALDRTCLHSRTKSPISLFCPSPFSSLSLYSLLGGKKTQISPAFLYKLQDL